MALTGQGLIIMLMGLSVVFIFLVSMILIMMASSRLFIRLAHLLPELPDPKARTPEKAAATDAGAVVAAIAAALHARKARL